MRKPSIKEKVPPHLHPFIAEQNPANYTPIDHASWRYILRVSRSFFAEHAHQKYRDGLRDTGISTERIPLISEMDDKLQQFGWRAVAIVGFIPPAVFMEFLSLGVLPIACDMRKLEHLSYTPAPDIVHEAAGHAPIIADPEYADYLHQYGEVSRKVIFSHHDLNVYEAIRLLSDTKEDPHSTSEQIEAAQKQLDDAVAAVDYVSEATELARMSWWTIEYGLVGDMKDPKIYGAGLLSSVSESFNCYKNNVKKLPFTLDCIKMTYDITKPQPQLYVTPDFRTLSKVLEEFAETLAFKRGGEEGLAKAKRARIVTTTVLDSGLQISGALSDYKRDSSGKPCYLQFTGPSQLSFADRELDGHGAAYHKAGFGTPVGKLKTLKKNPSELSDGEIQKLNGRFEFESGVVVEGKLKSIHRELGKAVVIAFEPCTVSLGSEVLFKPEWGTCDKGCGERVISVFGGAADPGRYLNATGGYKQRPALQKTNHTKENEPLEKLYGRVRALREKQGGEPRLNDEALLELSKIHDELNAKFPKDWLLRLELLEWKKTPWEKEVLAQLEQFKKESQDLQDLIDRGLALL